MIPLLYSILLIHSVLSDGLMEDPFTESGVYVLNQKNFDHFINSNDVVLVEFYAPWCGHCKTLAPIYSDAAQELSKIEPPIPLAKVDATVETELAQKFDVNGYPSLRYFKAGKPYDYDGDRSFRAIVSYMKNVASPNWKAPLDHVLKLTTDNFTETIQSSEYILVEFYAPWCGHCKSLAPEYAKAANLLAKNNPPIPLATVDAIQEKDLAKEYGVTGYPTLKLFRNGKPRDYSGPRYSEGIVEWMLKNRENSAKEVHSKSELNTMKDSGKVLAIGLFHSKDDSLYPVFIDATNRLRDEINSVVSFDESLRKLYKINSDDNIGSVLLVKAEYFANKYEPDYVKYEINDTTSSSAEAMVAFFEDKMLPLVGEYNYQTSPFYQKFPKEYLCIFFFSVDFSVHHRAATKMWLEKIIKIAVNYQDRIKFSVADDEKQSDKLKEFRLDDSGEDMNVGCSRLENVKYRMPPMDEFDSDHINNFLQKMLEGKIFPLLKSAPIPKLSSSVIKPVVGDTFNKLVNEDPSEAVLLLYRSPCDSCDALRNILQGLATKVHGKPFHFFATDLTFNDVPPMDGLENVDSQPSLYFVTSVEESANKVIKKKLIKFTGDRLKESDIRSFIGANSVILKDEL